MEMNKLKNILEAVLLAADRPLSVNQLEELFQLDDPRPTRDEIRKALHEMDEDFASRGFELKQVASGYRLQVKQEYSLWVGRLWEEKPARYTRALLETMALVAYRQPITRGEIEEVRGVSVSSNIIKTLLERDWIKVLGHKDVPGKPALFGTTREFLDYFNLKSLDELPSLAEIKDLDKIHPELELDEELDADAEQAFAAVSELAKEDDLREQQSAEEQSSEAQAAVDVSAKDDIEHDIDEADDTDAVKQEAAIAELDAEAKNDDELVDEEDQVFIV